MTAQTTFYLIVTGFYALAIASVVVGIGTAVYVLGKKWGLI